MRSNGNMDFSHSNTAFSSHQRGVAIMVTTRSFAHSYQSTWKDCIAHISHFCTVSTATASPFMHSKFSASWLVHWVGIELPVGRHAAWNVTPSSPKDGGLQVGGSEWGRVICRAMYDCCRNTSTASESVGWSSGHCRQTGSLQSWTQQTRYGRILVLSIRLDTIFPWCHAQCHVLYLCLTSIKAQM